MTLDNYLQNRKNKKLLELLIEHAGRCRAVGRSFNEATTMLVAGRKEDLIARVAIIKTEERSADEVEAKIALEVAKSSLPTKMGEDLLLFVRAVDRAAGAAKRAVINFEMISDYHLPDEFAQKINDSAEIIGSIFEKIETALRILEDSHTVDEICKEINLLESKIDRIYRDLKRGYFKIEKVFNSSAALIILDHAYRDIEASADYGEDAAELLQGLIERRG